MPWLQNLLGKISPELAQLDGIPFAVFVGVLALTALFFIGYLLKGLQVWWQLYSAIRKINLLKENGKQAAPTNVGAILRWEPFKHLWDEYQDSLHELKQAAAGDTTLTEVRATMPAEAFFTRDVLVDGRMFDDFTRHLPGVLTGLGIIGTFAGLLDGLSKFDPSTTSSAVAGLAPLMAGVKHAFVASALAIGCAMLVTFVSRLVLAYFYRLVEKLTQAIDSLYRTGAGEEYLSRLVNASEKSEAHAAQLKEALVEDLTKLMTNLVERQIEAQTNTTKLLGDRIGETIAGTLAAPIQKMTDAMVESSQGNSQAVSGMLESMLAGFMAKLEDTFGGQMRGINDQMERSMNAMTSVQQSLQQLLSDIAKTNETAANQMSGKLEDTMKKAAANQEVLTNQMREFVLDFRKLVTEEQHKSKQAMDEAVLAVLKNVTAAVDQLETVRKNSAAAEEVRGARLADETKGLVGGLSEQVDTLLKTVSEQVQKTQSNIDALGNVSLRAIDGMNNGALTMTAAAQRFETAGGAVSTVLERSSGVAEHLASTASTLQSTTTALRQGFEQYDSTRKTVDMQVAALTGLIESARKEAGLSKQLVTDLERVVEQLREAEDHSQQYLAQVNQVLVEAFEHFNTAMKNQVKATISDTDRHLGNGVNQLNGVVQELSMAMARMKKN